MYIYCLSDPRTKEVRYIGKTERSPLVRLSHHLCIARSGKRRYVYNWIRNLLKDGHIPIISILEICSIKGWEEREKYWIAYGKSIGWRLTNLTAGGEGTKGYLFTEEVKDKMRSAKVGTKLTEQHIQSIINHNGSRKLSTENVIAIRNLLAEGLQVTEIAYLFEISVTTVSSIRDRRTWKWLKESL